MAKTATVGMSEKVEIEFFDNIDQKPSETLKTDENLSLNCPEMLHICFSRQEMLSWCWLEYTGD